MSPQNLIISLLKAATEGNLKDISDLVGSKAVTIGDPIEKGGDIIVSPIEAKTNRCHDYSLNLYNDDGFKLGS